MRRIRRDTIGRIGEGDAAYLYIKPHAKAIAKRRFAGAAVQFVSKEGIKKMLWSEMAVLRLRVACHFKPPPTF